MSEEPGDDLADERAEAGRLQGASQAAHEAFIRNQARWHSTYMEALEHARACYREDSRNSRS